MSDVSHDCWYLPSLKILGPAKRRRAADKSQLEAQAQRVEDVLADLGLPATVAEILVGPQLTTFLIALKAGTPIRDVSAQANEIARGMGAHGVEVAPAEGRPEVELRLDLGRRRPTMLREMLATAAFAEATSEGLAVLIGETITGTACTALLDALRHVLIAGTTGAGKSMALHGMLLSLLFQQTPDHIRLVLLGSEAKEFAGYDGLPHLLAPPATDLHQAVQTLRAAQEEMDKRYRLWAAAKARSLVSYNAHILAEAGTSSTEAAPLPTIAIAIDALAPLLATAGSEIENLVRKGRAVGIHLLACVDGAEAEWLSAFVKASIPARLALRLLSARESASVLGQSGAERLRGDGDALFQPVGGPLIHVQAAMVTDADIAAIAGHWRAQGSPPIPHETDPSERCPSRLVEREHGSPVPPARRGLLGWLGLRR